MEGRNKYTPEEKTEGLKEILRMAKISAIAAVVIIVGVIVSFVYWLMQ